MSQEHLAGSTEMILDLVVSLTLRMIGIREATVDGHLGFFGVFLFLLLFLSVQYSFPLLLRTKPVCPVENQIIVNQKWLTPPLHWLSE